MRKEKCLQLTRISDVPMADAWQDSRFAARMILRPLKVPGAETLYTVERAIDGDSSQSYPNQLDLRDRNRGFSALAVYSYQHLGLDTGKNLSSVWAYGVGGKLLRRLGHSALSWPALSRRGFLASRVLAAIVFQAAPRDPLVLAGVVLAMAMLGLSGHVDSGRTRAVD